MKICQIPWKNAK